MVDDQVEADVVKVHFLHLVVKLRPLEHLKCVPVYVQHLI